MSILVSRARTAAVVWWNQTPGNALARVVTWVWNLITNRTWDTWTDSTWDNL